MQIRQGVPGIITRATPSFFRVAKIAPLVGRTFSDAEGEIEWEREWKRKTEIQRSLDGDRTALFTS